MYLLKLGIYVISWVVAVYVINSLIAKRFLSVNLKSALLYVSTMAALGVSGEIFVGNFYHHFFHGTLWVWQVFPIYKGYTSLYAPFLWGMYGFQLYLFHSNLATRRITKDGQVAAIFAVETIIVEILLNLTFLIFFGEYVFYYSPGDLWHFTSLQTLPFFFIASLIYSKSIKRGKTKQLAFTAMNLALCCAVVTLY